MRAKLVKDQSASEILRGDLFSAIAGRGVGTLLVAPMMMLLLLLLLLLLFAK